MRTLKIRAEIVPATYAQLISGAGVLKETLSVFYHRHNLFHGPRFLELEYLDEVKAAVNADFFYIIKFKKEYNPKEVPVIMRIRQANADDFQWTPKYQKYERVYYYNPEGNMIEGPLYYMPNSDLAKFNERLAAGQLFVPAEGQKLTRYQIEAKAS